MQKLHFDNRLEKTLFKNWIYSMFRENCRERRIWGETPYKNPFRYYRKNRDYLLYEWDKGIKDISLSYAEIS